MTICDDEILDDDFDIDDDFTDDFDIDDDSDLSPLDDNDSSDSDAGQRGFLQKFFLPIVIAIIALFGGFVALGTGLLSGSQPETSAIIAESTPLENEEIVTEVSNNNINEATNSTTNENVPVVNDITPTETALTPLPSGEDDVNILTLVDLDAELEEPVEDVVVSETNEALPALDLSFSDNNLENDAFNDAVELETIEALEVFETPATLPASNSDDLDSFTPPSEAIENTQDLADSLAEPTVADEVAQNITDNLINTQDANENVSNTDLLREKSEALALENEALSAEIAEKRDVIAALETKIAALQKEEIAQNNEVLQIPAAASPKPAAPSQVTRTVKKEGSKPAPRIKWVLRSAQPGKATLSALGSNDLRHVEVGNALVGIGRVTSIQNENGSWVVRGTQGKVSQ